MDAAELRKVVTQDQEALREYKALLKSPGWDRWLRLIEEQREYRQVHLNRPATGIGEVLHSEFLKGEINAFNTVLKNLDAEIERLSSEVQEILSSYPSLFGEEENELANSRTAP